MGNPKLPRDPIYPKAPKQSQRQKAASQVNRRSIQNETPIKAVDGLRVPILVSGWGCLKLQAPVE